jgi:peptidyl-prolyl cis-trans isomerase SurA
MTLSVPTFRSLLAGLAVSALSVSAISLSAQATSTPATQGAKAATQGPYQPQAQASPFNGTVVEDVVARVNDQIITRSDYQRALQQMDADARQQGVSEQELADRKKTLLRDLIDKELLLSKGKELGITGETELVKRLDEIRKQNHLDSMEDLEKAAQQQGVSYEDFKQNIRNEIISQSVIRQEVSRRVQLTKADVANYYRTHQAEFAQPESVHLASILIPVDGDNADSLAKAQAKAAEVESQLKAGASFEDLAKKDSSGPTASTGGDLGDFKRGMLPKPLEDATFDLKAGGVTQPIRTKQGMLIMKVTQHVGGASQDYASIEPQVEEAAFMSRMQPALRSYLSTLREQAYVDVRPGFQDAGAASNTVKPHIAYSAYVQPGKKKDKKKVVRTRFNETRHTFRNKSGSTQQTASKSSGSAAAPTAAPTTAPAAATTPAPAPAPSSSSNVAANVPSSKPVKKQKVRFGQAPTGTLDNAPGNTTAPAPATPAETQVASNGNSVSSNITGSGIDENTATAVKKQKTRFSARTGKQPKGETQDQLENQSQGQATDEEKATQQTQAAPLGLGGDTATKKKPAKVKSDQKTRYAEKPKAASNDANGDQTIGTAAGDANSGAAATAGTTPEAGAPATSSAPPASTPDEKAPLDTTPAQPGTTAPAAPSTPQTGPQ